ncbi:hypothetical protein QJQ45_008066 [Haematococcus lacustris]|nr:hypothetical protein QJQ45_008066 [Haematococcus lacustris]
MNSNEVSSAELTGLHSSSGPHHDYDEPCLRGLSVGSGSCSAVLGRFLGDIAPLRSNLLIPGLGGVTYWLSIFPVDCIKSAMQTDSIVRSERKYPDFITTAQKLWAEGGIKRFYKGFTPCIIRAAPANGVMLLTVEKVQALLKQG